MTLFMRQRRFYHVLKTRYEPIGIYLILLGLLKGSNPSTLRQQSFSSPIP